MVRVTNVLRHSNPYQFMNPIFSKNDCLKPVVSNLTNRTYIVSETSKGLGHIVARKLAEKDANVVIIGKAWNDQNPYDMSIYNSANTVNEHYSKSMKNCIAVPCDITRIDQIDKVIDETLSVFGSIDGLILNPSDVYVDDTEQYTYVETQKIHGLHIDGAFLLGQKCLKYISKSTHPSIISVSPPLAKIQNQNKFHSAMLYSISRFNLTLMTMYWNHYYKNVGVNTLWPSAVKYKRSVTSNLSFHDAFSKEIIDTKINPDFFGEAVARIVCSDPLRCRGNQFVDLDVVSDSRIYYENV